MEKSDNWEMILILENQSQFFQISDQSKSGLSPFFHFEIKVILMGVEFVICIYEFTWLRNIGF